MCTISSAIREVSVGVAITEPVTWTPNEASMDGTLDRDNISQASVEIASTNSSEPGIAMTPRLTFVLEW
ncbi:unnamed protein product [Parascedosporium putredinis]|uniref:Uncharacterized protein n=1 Tax=Parascedosporium putredinis TaxID=1442378 RepID=A0A9P1HBT9_9PEZI|nr:unnamed protein product [Parascedosporium putredinis]CAI8004246.1 unnamed protein product [Parascedosporium putredinis]